MKIDVLCSSENHPVNAWLTTWMDKRSDRHELRLLRCKDQLASGDLLFLVSCTEMIPAELRSLYKHSIVLHASDLPKGRGWSPHIWSILEGATHVTVSAITAEDRIDSGDVWAKESFDIARHELHDEINTSLFETEMALLDRVVGMVEKGETPCPQSDEAATYYPRRTPGDSELDPGLSIAEQFDKIRVSDPERYPAFFRMHGHVYSVSLRKIGRDE